ncbi:WYL domain-containing protein [Desulfopila sp. IMCC35006]|uniref:helix-turn-helix transcriptional regulator n=1 Tax=Desulfopila sp. IMCC35006 TaxID=2569542 RepID=UPI0010AC4E9F|nr:WYL domain-containing protein [Desulfopila sp. IMCC35006]TKB25283.1 WYL domain-containing protein [Desulfopila sp. IMCC35006]
MSVRLKYGRFLCFHGQIKAGRFPNANNLAETFELSGRTAQRDIEFIRDRLDAPLKYNHRHRGYYYTDDSYELPSLWISESNILASTIPDQALKDQLCRLIDRIPIITGDKSITCLEQISEKISVKNIEYSQVDRDIFRQSVKALFAGTSLNIIYHSPHTDTTTARIIHPLHLMHYMGSWHLIAWCGTRMQLRNFALSRIQTISFVTENLVIPGNFHELKEYTRKHFGIMQGNTSSEVGLHFAPKIAAWVNEQIWHPRERSTPKPGGSLTLHFPVADFRELIKTILGHGADIEVLELPELKTLVHEEIERMTKYIVCMTPPDMVRVLW